MDHLNLNLPQEEQSLLEKVLHGKSEAEKRRVLEVVLELGIAKNDPLFLVMMAMKSMEVSVEKVPERIRLQEEQFKATTTQLTDKIEELKGYTSGLTGIAENIDTRLKGQIPRSARSSGLLMKELAVAVLIALIAGTLFGRPVMQMGFGLVCDRVPGLCEVER